MTTHDYRLESKDYYASAANTSDLMAADTFKGNGTVMLYTFETGDLCQMRIYTF